MILPLDIFSTEDKDVLIHTQVLFINCEGLINKKQNIFFLED